jgi:hypothetical protein
MKRLGLSVILMIVFALTLTGCNLPIGERQPASPAEPTAELPEATAEPPAVTPEPPAATTEPEIVDDSQFEVVVMENAEGGGKFDIYLQNIATNETIFYATVENAQVQHYHAYEHHNGHIYVIKRVGDPDVTDDWADELWMYTASGEGKQVYALKGLDFRVSPDEAYIAVTGGDVTVGEQLVLLDGQGNELQRYTPDQVVVGPEPDMLLIGLLDWSDDGTTLWLESGGPGLTSFSRLAAATGEIARYDVLHLNIPRSDATLNVNAGKVAYSDYPTFYDAMNAQEFKDSGAEVTLYVYVLDTQVLQEIAVSTAKEFDPVWLDATTIEYNDPAGEGRVTSTTP